MCFRAIANHDLLIIIYLSPAKKPCFSSGSVKSFLKIKQTHFIDSKKLELGIKVITDSVFSMMF